MSVAVQKPPSPEIIFETLNAYQRTQALRAMELSKNRAAEIKKLLVERYSIDAKRIDIVGRGWEEPSGPNSDLNRRVEVQWFTVE